MISRATGRSRARSPAATWRSPTRECRTSAGSGPCRARPGEHPLDRLASRSPPATSRAARAAGRAARPRSARLDRDDEPGRGPGRVDRPAPCGTIACLRLAARSASGSKPHPPREAGDDPAIFSSISSSSSSSSPAKRATISAVRSSAVGPSPPLVTIRSQPSAAMNRSPASRSSGRSPTMRMWRPRPRARRAARETQGPLRSVIRPVITSVPVTRIPARTAHASRQLPSAPSASSRAGGRDLVGRRARRLGSRRLLPAIFSSAGRCSNPAGKRSSNSLRSKALAGRRRGSTCRRSGPPPAPEQADLDRRADVELQRHSARSTRPPPWPWLRLPCWCHRLAVLGGLLLVAVVGAGDQDHERPRRPPTRSRSARTSRQAEGARGSRAGRRRRSSTGSPSPVGVLAGSLASTCRRYSSTSASRVEPEELRVGAQEALARRRGPAERPSPRPRAPAGTWSGSSSAPRRSWMSSPARECASASARRRSASRSLVSGRHHGAYCRLGAAAASRAARLGADRLEARARSARRLRAVRGPSIHRRWTESARAGAAARTPRPAPGAASSPRSRR